MDEKIKDQEVLLVKDQKDENLKAVTGTDWKSHSTLTPLGKQDCSLWP